MSGRLGQALLAFEETARTPNLRRAQLSFGAEFTSDWAVTVGVGILAFRHGGAEAVGIVGLARMLPASLLAPPVSFVADRYRRDRVLAGVGLVRALSLGVAAALASLSSPVSTYVLVAVASLAHTLYRPTHSALLPSLCTTPPQLTSANVVRGLLDSASALLGPLLAGLLVGPLGVGGVFAVCAGASVSSAGLIWRVSYEAPPRVADTAAMHPAREAIEGLAIIRRRADIRLITVLGTMQTFTRGCFTVFSVVVALELLGLRASGVGELTAGFGAGAILGSIAASLWVRSPGLAMWFAIGIAAWGAPFIALAGASNLVVALALLGVVGVANAVVDVSGFTLLQWLTPDEVMGRVFTGFEAILTLGIALGSIGASGLIAVFGARGALVAAGLVGPVGVLLSLAALRRIDSHLAVRGEVVALLQRVAMLSPLPLATICRLGAEASSEQVSAGTIVVREGTVGDDFYVIADGQAEVSADGQSVAHLGAGDCFGEIAALSGGRRTTTVRAVTPLGLLRLAGSHFVRVVSGYRASQELASALVSERLGRAVSSAAADTAVASEAELSPFPGSPA